MKRAKLFLIRLFFSAAAAAFFTVCTAFAQTQPSAPFASDGALSARSALAAETLTSSSSATYARAASREAYFFAEKDLSSSLFAVPYTYCVEILRDDGDWYYAKYAEDVGIYRALYGYCLKEHFLPLTSPPETTYLYKTVSVTYTADGSQSPLPVLNELTVEAAYYGVYYAGATAYSYVLCNGSFGYITGANDDYELNADPTPATSEIKASSDDNVGSKIIVAVVLTVLAAAALVLLFFTGGKRGKTRG